MNESNSSVVAQLTSDCGRWCGLWVHVYVASCPKRTEVLWTRSVDNLDAEIEREW